MKPSSPSLITLLRAVIAAWATTSLAPATASAAGSVLARLELVGVLALGSQVQVCLADRSAQTSGWFKVGDGPGDIAITAYDPVREAAQVRVGAESRWILLQQGRVTELPVLRLPDGTIDPVHARMTEKQKAREAEMLMWDILEVGRQARLGSLPQTTTK